MMDRLEMVLKEPVLAGVQFIGRGTAVDRANTQILYTLSHQTL